MCGRKLLFRKGSKLLDMRRRHVQRHVRFIIMHELQPGDVCGSERRDELCAVRGWLGSVDERRCVLHDLRCGKLFSGHRLVDVHNMPRFYHFWSYKLRHWVRLRIGRLCSGLGMCHMQRGKIFA